MPQVIHGEPAGSTPAVKLVHMINGRRSSEAGGFGVADTATARLARALGVMRELSV